MEYIWLKVVKKEYDSSRILEESNLHSTVYPVRNNAPLLPPGKRPSGPAAAAGLWVTFQNDSGGV